MRFKNRVFAHFFFTTVVPFATWACGAEIDAPLIGARRMSLAEVAQLSATLKDADVSKAVAAAYELGASRQPLAAAPLLSFYIDGDGERRFAAVKALGALEIWNGPKKADKFLAIALNDISPSIRHQAARELAVAIGVEDATSQFMAIVRDDKAHTSLERNRAVHHVGALRTARGAGFLRATLFATDFDVALAAAEELGDFRDLESVDALLTALKSESLDLKIAALNALERISGKGFSFDLVKWTEWRASWHAAAPETEAPAVGQKAEYEKDPRPVDVVVAFDTTGSFLHIWPEVNRALDAVLRELAREAPSLRVGLVRYRAIDARVTLRYTLQPTPLTWNISAIEHELTVTTFGGGSGALHVALRYALNGMVWRERARKVVILIGDDSPVSSVEDPLKSALQLTRDAAILDGIQINTLYTKTTAGEENRVTYRSIAAAGIGRFYEYNKAEQHLVEMSAANVDVKGNELPAVTARKWLTPRAR